MVQQKEKNSYHHQHTNAGKQKKMPSGKKPKPELPVEGKDKKPSAGKKAH